MDDLLRTALRETVNILSDRQWHDVYELHQKYHVSAIQVFNAVNFLTAYGLIDKVGFSIKFIDELQNHHLSLLNKIQKTQRPKILDVYIPAHLTLKKK